MSSFIVIGPQNESTASVVMMCSSEDLDATMALRQWECMAPLSSRGYAPATNYVLQANMSLSEAEEFARRGGVSVGRDIEPNAHINGFLTGTGFRKIARITRVQMT